MKLLKRLLLVLAAVLGLIVLACSLGLMLFRAEPQWYRLPQISPEEREAAAQRATNKLAMIHNEAARARLQERSEPQAAGASTAPAATAPAGPGSVTVSFTDDELNAFFDKWAAWNNWKASYEEYLTDPVLILGDGRLILAARVRELNTVASLHFRPRIDEQGQLHLGLEQVLGGRLPLPQAALGSYRQRLIASMQQRLPHWRSSAAMDRSGSPNTAAICATMGELLVDVLNDRPADAVLFLPLVDQGAVPVRLTEVQIGQRTLTLTVVPLGAPARTALLERIRNGTWTAMGP